MQKCSTNGDRDRDKDRGKTTTISTVGRHTANRVVLIIGRQDWHRIVVTARRQRLSSCHHYHHHQHRRLLLCSSAAHTSRLKMNITICVGNLAASSLLSCVFESPQTDRQSVSEVVFLLPSLWQFSASSSRTHCHISRCWAQCQAAAVDDAADADTRAILMAPLSLPSLSIFPLFSSVGAVILFGHP